MAIKYKEGTTEKGWATTITEGTSNVVNTVKYTGDGVTNFVVWKKPLTVAITDYSNNYTNANIFRPGANNTNSQYTNTKSKEPLATDKSFTSGTINPPAIDSTKAQYGTGLFYDDVLYITGTPYRGYYYYSITAGQLPIGGQITLQGNATYAWPPLYNTWNLTFQAPHSITGYTLQSSTNGSSWTDVTTSLPTTIQVSTGQYLRLYFNKNNVTGVSTTGVHWFPAIDWDDPLDARYEYTGSTLYVWWCYRTHMVGVGISPDPFIGESIPSPVTAVPTFVMTPTEYLGYFYKVQGQLYNSSSGSFTLDINGAYWTCDKTDWPNISAMFILNLHKQNWGSQEYDYYALNDIGGCRITTSTSVIPPDTNIKVFLKDLTGGYVPSTNGTDWQVYSGTKYAQNTVYYKSNNTEYISNYTWNLGQIDFNRYYKYTVTLVNTQIEPGSVWSTTWPQLGPGTHTLYLPTSSWSFTITGTVDTDKNPDNPLFATQQVNCDLGYTRIYKYTNSYEALLWAEVSDDNNLECSFRIDRDSLTWGKYKDLSSSMISNNRTVMRNDQAYAIQEMNIVIEPTAAQANNWFSLSGSVWGHWGSNTNTALLYDSFSICGVGNVVNYYSSQKVTSNTSNVFTFESLRFADLLGERTFSKNQTYTFIGYNTTYRNYGAVYSDTSSPTLTPNNMYYAIKPTMRNATYATQRRVWNYERQPGGLGISEVGNLYDVLTSSAAANDAAIHRNTTKLLYRSATSAPTSWNSGTGTTLVPLIVVNRSKTVQSSYTFTDQVAQEYRYSANHQKIVVVTQPVSTTFTVTEPTFDWNDYCVTNVNGYISIKIQNPNPFAVTINNITDGYFVLSTGEHYFGEGEDYDPCYSGETYTIPANDWSDWLCIGDTSAEDYRDVSEYGFIVEFTYNGSFLCSVEYVG